MLDGSRTGMAAKGIAKLVAIAQMFSYQFGSFFCSTAWEREGIMGRSFHPKLANAVLITNFDP
jgi:hypothetical protein